MQLLSISNRKCYEGQIGVTLFEIIIVFSIIGILFKLSFVGLETYADYSFNVTRDRVVGTLMKARSQSINSVCFGDIIVCTNGMPHGVHFESNLYVLFQGDGWAVRDVFADEIIQIDNQTISVAGSDVVFLPLSGDSVASGIEVNSVRNESSLISVFPNGRIVWSN